MSSSYANHNNAQNNFSRSIKYYFRRYLGSKYSNIDPQPKPSHFIIVIWSFITSFIGIGTLGLFTWNIEFFREREIPVSIGSMGATAIMIYGTCDSPFAQPRNLYLGHITSSLIGITVNIIMKEITSFTTNPISYKWLTCALAVSLSMLAMQLTNTIHPPAGATALMIALDDPKITSLGYLFAIVPILLGVTLMFLISLILINIQNKYPIYWWKQKIIDDQRSVFPDLSQNDDLEVGQHFREVTFPTPVLSFNVRKENRENFHNNNTSRSNSFSENTLANKSSDSSSCSVAQSRQNKLSLSEANEYISKLENELNELRKRIQQLEL
ncbi:4893_t:CDS:2 [Funneliformis geosporum]|uniref:10922_t:CDS:1 n=1 Tax=Funneliformis geosporum TaxID=1117311 RepID=A0A9W4SN93_9GLOM|nr:4893_t:CDS:2 [Funneliformis geosporum]CAI2175501.1 10922_t:CDS:2 [Funneliformis geosporum]